VRGVFSRNVGYQIPTYAAQLRRGVTASTAPWRQPKISRRVRTSCLNCVAVTIFMWLHRTFIESWLCLTWKRYNLHDDFEQFLSRIFPDVLFYHHIDSFHRKANCPFVRLSATASYFKQTQRLYIFRVPSAFWFNKKQICCVWIWPCTSSRNHNFKTLRCLLKLWPPKNYMMFSNYVASNIRVKFSRPSHVQRLTRAFAASYNEHPVYKNPVLTSQ
jgi:hypothetical protein